MLIRKAFMELLRQKPIQSISIRELCDQAGINRGTFYTHYTDIHDLLRQIEDEMMADFEKAMEPLLTSQEESFNPVAISTGIFQCLKDNSDLCTVTLSDYGDKQFALRLINMGRERCMALYLKYFKDATPKDIEYYYAFVSAGCIGLLRKWLDDGMTSSAGEIAQMAENIMMYGLGVFRKTAAPPPKTDK
jgi:AcrR family transcriptional regulator